MDNRKPDMSDAVEQIKDRIDIVDIVSDYVALKKSGRNFWGCCPFHKEKTPSFSVNPEKGIFKCFGCGVGGDAISFLMKLNSSNFMETITDLAQRYGIELPKFGFSSDKTELKKEILNANKIATQFFIEQLFDSNSSAKAKEYLKKRDISDETILEFGIGYAPQKSDALSEHLISKHKLAPEMLEQAGLILPKKQGSGYIDRFRHRIIIPIYNEKGEIIAFGARALEDNQNPKYLNSPETPVFNKSRTLYGIYQAKDSVKEEDKVLIMEGYFDVISASTKGLRNVVATCGTALTEQHLKILGKYTMSKKIYLAFDSDDAGRQAANRGAEIIKESFGGLGEIKQFEQSYSTKAMEDKFSCEIRVVTTSSGKDPDEFIRSEGVDSYKKCIKEAPLLIDYQINSIMKSKQEFANPQEKIAVIKQLVPVLAEINNKFIQDEYIKKVSLQLSVDYNTLKSEITTSKKGETYTESTKQPIVKNSSKKHVKAQKNLLSLYFIDSEKLPYSCINEKVMNIEFTEANLVILKKAIEETSKTVNNVEELSNKLLEVFAENTEIKDEIVDLIYSTKDKEDMLNRGLIDQYISENLNCIHTYYKVQQNENLRSQYTTANQDEISSLQLQYQVREQIKMNRHRLEIINGETKE